MNLLRTSTESVSRPTHANHQKRNESNVFNRHRIYKYTVLFQYCGNNNSKGLILCTNKDVNDKD